MPDRWATFDCYGTLIDWNAGIGAELARIFGDGNAPRLLARYHEVEPQLQREDPSRSYREVLTLGLERLAAEEGVQTSNRAALADSLPRWDPFPDAPAALEELRARGWRLALLSNSDPDLLAASQRRLGVPFDASVAASAIGSFKPAPGHWEHFFSETGAGSDRHVHVGASHFHDVVPAAELGLRTVWINRLREGRTEPRPARELPDLRHLPDILDELVPV